MPKNTTTTLRCHARGRTQISWLRDQVDPELTLSKTLSLILDHACSIVGVSALREYRSKSIALPTLKTFNPEDYLGKVLNFDLGIIQEQVSRTYRGLPCIEASISPREDGTEFLLLRFEGGLCLCFPIHIWVDEALINSNLK